MKIAMMIHEKTKVCESVVYRALEVQELYRQHKEEDLSNVYIFRKYIRPEHRISIRTFYRYLAIPARRIIKQIESEELTA